MAVTPPVAPTPPTPPSVPKVMMGDGGSVTESTVPQNSQQTDAQRQEAQARQAVARGDGALSKTTQARPDAKNEAQQGQQQTGSQQNGATPVVQTDPQAAAALQADAAQEQGGQAAQASAQTMTGQQPASPLTQGAGYWAFTFAMVVALAFVFYRVAMKKRRGGKGELSAEDIRQAVMPEAEDLPNLRGMTPDEVLRQLEEQEQLKAEAEMRQARAEAKQRLAAAKASRGVPVHPSRGESAAAAPKQAAQQYREQVTAMPPAVKTKPKRIVRKPPATPEDKEHFEISV